MSSMLYLVGSVDTTLGQIRILFINEAGKHWHSKRQADRHREDNPHASAAILSS
jgi:hypothetical protein